MNRRFALKLLGGIALGGAARSSWAAAPQQAPAADREKLTMDNNAFALDLYAKLRSQEGNLFLSPASISIALAMTYAGAREHTAEQFAKAMHFSLPQEKLHPAFGALLRDLNSEGRDIVRGYELSVANALWGQKGYPWKQDFLKTTRDNYGAGLQEVDFVGATEAARKTINTWVEQHTKDKIKELIKEGILDAMTRLVLTNAIYFKGDWAAKFDKKATVDQQFMVAKDKTVKTPLMSRKGEYRLFEDRELQVLDMPYKGKELSMFVVLP
ncbi:MAG TPA: serpin family protein, partial [Gemmataceae bacterium]|nr:serpin family protein [Gemmataceae bacterium]